MSDASVLINEIREMKRKLDEIEKTFIRLLTENEEVKRSPRIGMMSSLRKSRTPKKAPGRRFEC